jgi:hypothetical protein
VDSVSPHLNKTKLPQVLCGVVSQCLKCSAKLSSILPEVLYHAQFDVTSGPLRVSAVSQSLRYSVKLSPISLQVLYWTQSGITSSLYRDQSDRTSASPQVSVFLYSVDIGIHVHDKFPRVKTSKEYAQHSPIFRSNLQFNWTALKRKQINFTTEVCNVHAYGPQQFKFKHTIQISRNVRSYSTGTAQ